MPYTPSPTDTNQGGAYSELSGAVDEPRMFQGEHTSNGIEARDLNKGGGDDIDNRRDTYGTCTLRNQACRLQTIALCPQADANDGHYITEGQGHVPVGTPGIIQASVNRRSENYNPTHRCKLCNQDFASLTNAKRHILAHYRISLHVCECRKTFTTKQDLRRHIDKLASDPAAHSIVAVNGKEQVKAEKAIRDHLIPLKSG